ncbi:hypothetical protein HCJ45_00060 [Listeria sp. FSL L7-1517]|nr:hypothetical protein [Listeria immobilis]
MKAIKEIADLFTPIGDGARVMTGEDPITGDKLSWGERGLSLLFIIPLAKIGKYVAKGFKFVTEGVEDLSKLHKKADKGKDAEKSTKKASGAKVKIEISKERLEHANLGDFTKNPKTGAISKMKGGGHGQDNIDFLRKNGIEVNIEKTYSNGVRVGNVPEHKTKSKQKGSNQSWFPKNWTAADIENAGQQIARLPEFAKVNDGEVLFGEVNGVRVGVIKTNGKIGTIFPDATRQP